MEKNILPIAVANSRYNLDINGYGTKDSWFSNVYFETYEDAQSDTQRVFCVKRPGISTVEIATPTAYGVGLGCYAAQPYTSTSIFFAVKRGGAADIFHYDGSNTVLATTAATAPTYNRVNFVNIGLPDDTYTTAFTAGTRLFLMKDRSSVTNVDPTASAHDLTRPAYLNNRVFVGDRVAGTIYQSNLGAYSTFSASEYIAVESYGGKLVEIGRYNNFIVAFKEYSTEFFEDVANTNGSVLGRVGQAIQQVGCVHPNTVVDTGAGELFWLGTDESGQHSVVRLSDSFKVEQIQDEVVSKYLNLITNYDGSYAFLLNTNGHQFYVLTLKQSYTDTTTGTDITNITFAYDLKTKMWTHWYTLLTASNFSLAGVTYNCRGRWTIAGACRNLYNTNYVQDHTSGMLNQLDDAFTGDKNLAMPVRFRLANLDLGTYKRKFINKLTLYMDGAVTVSDIPTMSVSLTRGDGSVGETISSWTVPRYPYSIRALGSYKRFTFDLVHQDDTKLRISAINFDYDIGEGHGIS